MLVSPQNQNQNKLSLNFYPDLDRFISQKRIEMLTFEALFMRYVLNKDFTDVYTPDSAILYVELLGEIYNQSVLCIP